MKYSSDEESDLLTFLVKLFPQSSKSTLRKMLTSGMVIVDGKICNRAKHEVVVGTNIEILDKVKAAEESPPPRAQYTGPKIDIIFEDE